MSDGAAATMIDRLATARALAWLLLLAGWAGLGSFAFALAADTVRGFALVALWLLALGGAATVATRDSLQARHRRLALIACGTLAACALLASVRGAGLTAFLLALLAWAAMTALASGVVRRLRRVQLSQPAAPVGAAALGAALAALVLWDLADLVELSTRLAIAMALAALTLALLQPEDAPAVGGSRCRAGLFDCSLPAWPTGAWRDLRQWPTQLAGLTMLPMMAALPLMADWCRSSALPPPAMTALHLGAMFAPAWLLHPWLMRWSAARLALACALGLGTGAACALWAPPPWNLVGVALAQGAAWGIAWAGQLWAPARRGEQGASPLRAAVGYALITLAFGALVQWRGAEGLLWAHAALGAAALLALLLAGMLAGRPIRPAAAVTTPSEVTPTARQGTPT